MKRTTFFLLVQLSVWAVFVALALGMVFAKGICCADDSFHAHVAKNIANGVGFASTFTLGEVQYSVRLFDPLLGTGPTIILPAALVIQLTGNTYWAPGLSTVILWATLLLAIGFLMNKSFANPTGMMLAAITVFSFFYLFFVFHFENWYAMLGEIPAVLLVILAVLLFFWRETNTNHFIVGVIFSLASLAKIVTLLLFGSFGVFIFILQVARYRNDWKQLFRGTMKIYIALLVGFLAPFMLFELWKIVTLGLTGYLQYWSNYLSYISQEGVTTNSGLLATLSDRIGIIRSRFGVVLPFVFIVIFVAGLAIRKEHKIFVPFVSLAFLASVYTVYWIFLSIGWPRYFIIGLILCIFVLGLPFLSEQRRMGWKISYAALMMLFAMIAWRNYNVLYPFENIRLFTPSSDVQALQKIDNMLASQDEKKPFLTQWWATSIDIEYMLQTHQNFTTEWDPDFRFDQPFIVAVNSRFMAQQDERFNEILDVCNVKEFGTYIYAECPPQSGP